MRVLNALAAQGHEKDFLDTFTADQIKELHEFCQQVLLGRAGTVRVQQHKYTAAEAAAYHPCTEHAWRSLCQRDQAIKLRTAHVKVVTQAGMGSVQQLPKTINIAIFQAVGRIAYALVFRMNMPCALTC